MVVFSSKYFAAAMVLFAVPAFGSPLAEQAIEADTSANNTLVKRWNGIKAYSYSDSCGADNKGDGTDYTWVGPMTANKCYHHVVNGKKWDMWSVEFDGTWGENCLGFPSPILFKGYDCKGSVGGNARGESGKPNKCYRYGSNPKNIGSFKSFMLGCQAAQGGK
ncbi:hypothetical protein GQ44DRAFT_823843 [Phaeosphaeriaceae sp. PMI808]|nr:hypothetical protein GQ44DRAFT_823843 [Phaeosphaeriaceae sp. PMI808]